MSALLLSIQGLLKEENSNYESLLFNYTLLCSNVLSNTVLSFYVQLIITFQIYFFVFGFTSAQLIQLLSDEKPAPPPPSLLPHLLLSNPEPADYMPSTLGNRKKAP